MKIISIFLLLISFKIYSQVEPSVTYDPISGNYIIEYIGYVGEEESQTLIREIFEPSTKISPSINSDLNELTDSMLYKYNYEIFNGSLSTQRLYNFYIDIYSTISQITKPNINWHFGFFSYRPTFHWYNSKDPSGLANPHDGIPSDSAAKGFSFLSSGLPTIVSAYFRGNPKIFLSFPDEPPGEIEDLLRPLTKFPNNTVVKFSVGPRDRSDPLIHEEFVDTLIYYCLHSHELGWINNQETFDKYHNLLGAAKAALEQSDIVKTRSALEEILRETDVDSSSTLSSEAYALLRYNTEYLLEQLPAEGFTMESISPTITITKTKDFTLTVYGSDFTKKSEVYWNGKKKKTKFISENVLEAEIKDKDIKKEGTYTVHVSEKKVGRTEELEFNVYKELPEKIIPVLNCIEELEKNKYLAWFGYENYNNGIVLLDDKENEIKGGDKKSDKPPVIFLPGIHEKVFSVEYDKKDELKWELGKEKAEVTEDSPLCQ